MSTPTKSFWTMSLRRLSAIRVSHRFDCVAETVYDSQGRTAEQRSGIIHDEEV